MATQLNTNEMRPSPYAPAGYERDVNALEGLAGEFHRVSHGESFSIIGRRDLTQRIAHARSVSRRREKKEMILDARRAQLNKMEQLSRARFIRIFISQAYLDELAVEIEHCEQMLANWQD